ncbi:exonuclease domain-containing protein [Amaricoccus sp.]|uniref:exonuclease domain-containing protein n=1 Tax=Amaricoccus sp. TaxID=1872485 RepID=UPI001B67E7C2|nr:exonuclease domain-containing protein [Amaricoccus sp.]MBP7003172.1 PAS domain-containing protein [Amaricoccus sp.]
MGAGPAIAAGLAAGFGLVWGATWLAGGSPGAATAAAAAAAAVLLAAVVAGFRLVVAPAARLARRLRALRESRSEEADVPSGSAPLLGPLAGEVDGLVTALRAARRDGRKAAQTETARVDAQKAWLETILQGLAEGVVVCNRQHRILLCNQAAVSLLGAPEAVGLGRNLGDLVALAPINHSLGRLEARHTEAPEAPLELSAPFACTTADRSRLFHGRMALLADPSGAVTGYLVTLVDISGELALLARGDGVRRALTRDLRGMVGNLRAAAETMAAFPEMPAGDRAAFERVLLDESARISATIDDLGAEIRGHMLGRWPMADIYSGDLVRMLAPALAEKGLKATLVGLPLWLHGDSLSLLQALEALIGRIHEETEATAFEIEPMLGDKRVYLDLVWEGAPVPAGTLEGWLDLPCGEGEGRQRLRDVLERHGSEPWSTPAGAGTAKLRLPLLAPDRPQFVPGPRRPAPRPEFYDFGLMQAHQGDEKLGARRLREIDYVVFDCETTGLRPAQGDEIIQIGAVRVVQGRILTGEGYERLVNPGRPIPPGSIKFHGVTDADVAGKPSIGEILPEFHAYVADAVMVGHNAAFDMKFLSLKERAAGVRFGNPVLDTMLVSSMLDGNEEDHSLDGLCARYGVAIEGRHSALGDAIATAQLLIKLMDRLEARGLMTFGDVMRASNMAAELRQRSAVFAGG